MVDQENNVITNENNEYIEAIQELKANSVSRDEYNKIKEENKKLLDTLVSGGQIEVEEKPVDLDELRNDLFNKQNQTNLEYVEKTLRLREELMKRGEKDPFLGNSINGYTEQDVALANRVANGLQHCVDVANGNSAMFNAELERIMVDTLPIRRR